MMLEYKTLQCILQELEKWSIKPSNASAVLWEITLWWTAQVILPANPNRKWFEIWNNSNDDLFVWFGITAWLDEWFKLFAGGWSYSAMWNVSTQEVSVFAIGTWDKFTYIEY